MRLNDASIIAIRSWGCNGELILDVYLKTHFIIDYWTF